MPAPCRDPIPLPEGFAAGGVHCGLRDDPELPDLGLLLSDHPRPAAAIFTTNRLLGAHVHVCREHLQHSDGQVRAIIVNARNANCATGSRGIEDARAVCAALAERIDCPRQQVLMASTGPIGAPLPRERILAGLDQLLQQTSPAGGDAFARAILTTDTFSKTATRRCPVAGGDRRLSGFAKGAGMIHPDMATMLAFVLADATPQAPLATLLASVCRRSFHRLSVDGDTSPNDTVVLWAGGQACSVEPFTAAATEVGQQLARDIARDGEGATRLVTIEVRGAANEADAERVGRTIATSPLVKTAVAGRDPNWGRILSAAGRCGVPFDPDREPAASRYLDEHREIVLGIDLALGPVAADFWTCDLTCDYVQINADYRT